MNIIVPLSITESMLGAGTTIAEPAASETAWSGSSVSYSVGDYRIRTTTHRVYKCLTAHTSAASPLPEDDPTRWLDYGPTQRHAPFDEYTSTAAATVTTMTYVVSPGFFNAVALYGLTGTGYSITVKDAPGGTTIYSASGSLYEDAAGWYEYLFSPPTVRRKLVFTGIEISPTAELTVTITAGTGDAVGIGMLVIGDLRPLSQIMGGTVYGASVEPVTYSYMRTNDDGTTTIVRRHAATNLRVTVVMDQEDADAAVQGMQDVLDTPVAWIATTETGYDGLNAFGLGSGSLSYDGPNHATLQINVRGLI